MDSQNLIQCRRGGGPGADARLQPFGRVREDAADAASNGPFVGRDAGQ